MLRLKIFCTNLTLKSKYAACFSNVCFSLTFFSNFKEKEGGDVSAKSINETPQKRSKISCF